MQIKLGEKIKELRKRDGRKQEDLAVALGVTNQAVSRWESNGGYPDMEMIPAIANYFGISIDELFGYQNDREAKIDAIIQKVDAFSIKSRSDDEWVDECLTIIREGLAEFPQNERLLLTLADTLSEAGWRRHKEWLSYDEEGFLCHRYDIHKKNEYWAEAIKLCEYLTENASDDAMVTEARNILVMLYRNIGETEKAIACAQKMPCMKTCRELMLASASDGKEAAKYLGDYLVEAARKFAQQLIYALMNNKHHYESDMPIEKIKGVINLFYLVCDDGNMGICHGDLIELYLYLSRIQWERGYRDEAFVSLDESLKHARALEAWANGNEHSLTAPLVSKVTFQTRPVKGIAKSLPDDWPCWSFPDCTQTEKEIKADPRWNEWVKRTQE